MSTSEPQIKLEDKHIGSSISAIAEGKIKISFLIKETARYRDCVQSLVDNDQFKVMASKYGVQVMFNGERLSFTKRMGQAVTVPGVGLQAYPKRVVQTSADELISFIQMTSVDPLSKYASDAYESLYYADCEFPALLVCDDDVNVPSDKAVALMMDMMDLDTPEMVAFINANPLRELDDSDSEPGISPSV